jgi:hypothetical protein
MPGFVVWHDGFRTHEGFFSEKGVFVHEAFEFKLIHSFYYVEIHALRVMEYSTVKDNEYKTLMIGDTAKLPFNEMVQTRSALSGCMPAFTVYAHPLMVVRTDPYMLVSVEYRNEIVISRVKAYYADQLDVWVDTVERVFKNSSMGVVADYKFSTVDYASTVPMRDRKFLSNRTTFESVFGKAKNGVLYAYWRHEDKAEPTRRLTGKKRKVVYLEEPQCNEIYVSYYFDEPEDPDEPE